MPLLDRGLKLLFTNGIAMNLRVAAQLQGEQSELIPLPVRHLLSNKS